MPAIPESPSSARPEVNRAAALSEQELDRLEFLLASPAHEGKAVPLDALQGLLCAVLSSPQAIAAEKWLPYALGDTPHHASDSDHEIGRASCRERV